VSNRLDPSPSITLVISGDPIVGRSLALLLRSSNYNAKFLSTSSLLDANVLEGVQFLMLAPTPELSANQREALLASLRNISGVGKMQILELSRRAPAQNQEGEGRDKPPHVLHWPCSIKELERRIEMLLGSGPL
jgi:hypothetical protein